MGFRFRKSIKIFPGIRINLSKSGISTSVGVPGATVNIKGNKTTTTVGLPGTGVSYDHRRRHRSRLDKTGALAAAPLYSGDWWYLLSSWRCLLTD